ncbi:putative quinol monooxygenase [Hymenobacter coalescens]
MLIRIVRMTFRPEAVTDFLGVFRASEDQIRQQPGCRHMELWQDADQPHVFCTHSHWDSATDLDAYRRSALFGQVWPATKRLFAAPPLAFSVHAVTGATAQLPPPALPDSVL